MENIILGSILLSILQSILFWQKRPGISVILFVCSGIYYFYYILKKNQKIENPKALVLIVPIILLSATYFIFQNLFFQIINSIFIITLFIIMTMYLTKANIETPQILKNFFRILFGAIENIDEVIQNITKLKSNTENGKTGNIKKIGKSIIISLPIIIVVLILLSSADSIFGNLFIGINNWVENMLSAKEITLFISRVLVAVVVFLYISGYIVNLIKDNTFYNQIDETKSVKKIEIENLTINMIVTILNIIYAVFCFIQITNLFMRIGNQVNFNYAEYARQGFFQLMFVSFINFGIIIITSVNKKTKSQKYEQYQKVMNIFLIIFTVIIIISAFFRMNLYEQKYGYTYLRLFVYYILTTEIIYMIPLTVYILRKKIDLIKSGILIVTIMYLIINFSNIDYTIAKKNIDRYFENQEENEIDFYYLSEYTGTDAIPQIKRLLNSNDKTLVERTRNYLYEKKKSIENEQKSWQEFNLSEWKAINELLQVDFNIEKVQ